MNVKNWVKRFWVLCVVMASFISFGQAQAAIDCQDFTPKGEVITSRLKEIRNSLSDVLIKFKEIPESEQLKVYAKSIEYWRILGIRRACGMYEACAFIGIGMKKGITGEAPELVMGDRIKEYAKETVMYSTADYRFRVGMISQMPDEPVFPSNVLLYPTEAMVKWAHTILGYQITAEEVEIKKRVRYCDLITDLNQGKMIEPEDDQWAQSYERTETNYKDGGVPPQWQNALNNQKIAIEKIKVAVEKRNRELAKERAAQESFEQGRKRADKLAERVYHDESLNPSEISFLCKYYDAICARASQLNRYYECLGQASENAAGQYRAAVSLGSRPTDGTWSGTYRQLEAQHKNRCQYLWPQ